MRIKDIAREAGVSTATVSHVINKTKYVSDETREKVQRAIKKFNYHPNAHAQMLALGRSKAHDLLYDIARKVAQSGEHLLDALEADPEIRKHADRKKLKAMVDPANYLGVAGPMVDRVLKGRKKKY